MLAAVFWPSGSGRSADGPFSPSSKVSGFSLCQPIPGSVITFGLDQFRNAGSSPATIQKIGYVHPRGLKILDAFVVPVHHKTLYGAQPGYPPKWMHAARSLTVPPDSGDKPVDHRNIIIVTKLTGKTGHADAAYLSYEENGVLYRFRTGTSLTVKHGAVHPCT